MRRLFLILVACTPGFAQTFSFSTCGPTSMSFVFGIPQTLDISLSATATSGFGVPAAGRHGVRFTRASPPGNSLLPRSRKRPSSQLHNADN
jgi:hypothetical protein